MSMEDVLLTVKRIETVIHGQTQGQAVNTASVDWANRSTREGAGS